MLRGLQQHHLKHRAGKAYDRTVEEFFAPLTDAAEMLQLIQQPLEADPAFVYVVDEGGVARMRQVTTGHTAKGRWVIVSGISAGDRVIVEGLPKVRPDTPVKVAAPAASQS